MPYKSGIVTTSHAIAIVAAEVFLIFVFSIIVSTPLLNGCALLDSRRFRFRRHIRRGFALVVMAWVNGAHQQIADETNDQESSHNINCGRISVFRRNSKRFDLVIA